ncbi:hypothetical protein ACJMK2_004389 [Sinanodonta woodiana]|uniref:Uncharacterized protein n=1 Tax=Sinanodonta woodiana TaxID=1069815 RepID=A0ABD3Y2K8_SINWO
MSGLNLLLLLDVQMVYAIYLAMSSPLKQTSIKSQMNITSQTGKPTAARIVLEGKGKHCNYGYNRSQYCPNGCCVEKQSSRNTVCCKGISNDSQGTSKHQDLIGISALFLVVVVIIAYQCRLSRINDMCLKNGLTEETVEQHVERA